MERENNAKVKLYQIITKKYIYLQASPQICCEKNIKIHSTSFLLNKVYLIVCKLICIAMPSEAKIEG
jgi:hypothetical protein